MTADHWRTRASTLQAVGVWARLVLGTLAVLITLVAFAYLVSELIAGDRARQREAVATLPLCVDVYARGRRVETICPDTLGRMP